jgi:hypothetical protein
MTNKDEALKMAHKTFMQLNERSPRKEDGSGYFDKEIIACKKALEQPAQKSYDQSWYDTHPKQPAQEPVYFVQHPNGYGWIDVNKDEYNQEKYDEDKWKLYTHPHQWQRLTDDEIYKIRLLFSPINFLGIIRAIEQALKEKNHA